MKWDKQVLAIASGVVVGGFLFLRFGFDLSGRTFGWEWYQGAALLGAMGLAGVFPGARLPAAIGVGLAPLLIEIVRIVLRLFRDPTCCNLWPIGLAIVFVFGIPAPLIGSGISRLLMRTRIPGTIYLVPLTSCLMIGVLSPSILDAQRLRFESERIPRLLQQIYDAEIVYSAHESSGNFACKGTLLPGAAGKLGWSLPGRYLFVQYYTISLDCPDDSNLRSFQVKAFSQTSDVRASSYSIDETGKLVVVPVR